MVGERLKAMSRHRLIGPARQEQERTPLLDDNK